MTLENTIKIIFDKDNYDNISYIFKQLYLNNLDIDVVYILVNNYRILFEKSFIECTNKDIIYINDTIIYIIDENDPFLEDVDDIEEFTIDFSDSNIDGPELIKKFIKKI